MLQSVASLMVENMYTIGIHYKQRNIKQKGHLAVRWPLIDNHNKYYGLGRFGVVGFAEGNPLLSNELLA